MADVALTHGWLLDNSPVAMELQANSLSVPYPFRLGQNGSIGFQLEGGVITVNATSPEIDIFFDRPMVYNGAHSHVPGGTPYDIGTPSLAADARSIIIPITVGSQSLVPTAVIGIDGTTVAVEWGETARILNSRGWYITTVDGTDVSVQSVRSGSSTQTWLTTTTHTAGKAYVLHIPPQSVLGVTSNKVNDAHNGSYTGASTGAASGNGENVSPIWPNVPPYTP